LNGQPIYLLSTASPLNSSYKRMSLNKPTLPTNHTINLNASSVGSYLVGSWMYIKFQNTFNVSRDYNFLFDFYGNTTGNGIGSFFAGFYLYRSGEIPIVNSSQSGYFTNQTKVEYLIWTWKTTQNITFQAGDNLILKVFLNVSAIGRFSFYYDSSTCPTYFSDPVSVYTAGIGLYYGLNGFPNSTNWKLANTNDADTSYVYSLTDDMEEVGDFYTITDSGLNSSCIITAIEVHIISRSTHATYKSKHYAHIYNGTDRKGSLHSPPTSYTEYTDTWTGIAYSELANLQIGVSIISGVHTSGGLTLYYVGRCTQVYAVIYYYVAGAKSWHTVATWEEDLIARQWSVVSTWSEFLSARQWNTVATWYESFITRQWNNIATWEESLQTRNWNTVATWNFDLSARGWFVVSTWTFYLHSYTWTMNMMLEFLCFFFILLACFLVFYLGYKKD
jgi:hypothetical protein